MKVGGEWRWKRCTILRTRGQLFSKKKAEESKSRTFGAAGLKCQEAFVEIEEQPEKRVKMTCNR